MQDEIQNESNLTLSDTEANADGRNDITAREDIDVDGDGVKAESADNDACEGDKGEKTGDTPENENTPIYEQVGWKEKVQKFLRDFPIAKDFAAQIGREIADSKDLLFDQNCLEKALAITLAKGYVAPEKLAADEDFLQKYVYSNQAVKDRIIQDYFDELQHNQPPKSISTRGQMTLAPPSRPKSIAEAGSVIRAMLNNRRI